MMFAVDFAKDILPLTRFNIAPSLANVVSVVKFVAHATTPHHELPPTCSSMWKKIDQRQVPGDGGFAM